MRFKSVCVESIGFCLPENRIASSDIEQQLAPLYERLRLPEGRLELMTGIQERRFWDRGVLPSEKSIQSAEHAIAAAGLDRHKIGALIHASVCRDHLEPATACRVHHELGLSPQCVVYDVSNACLGILNGMVQVASMIELGQIQAGLVVGTEGSRELVENTIAALNENHQLTRRDIKPAIASLTIGSASCAVLLAHRDLAEHATTLDCAVARAESSHHDLCQSDHDQAVAAGMSPLMDTDSEQLMRQGVAAGAAAFESFLGDYGCRGADINKTVCHQVGSAHRAMMLGELGIDEAGDYATYEWLGNTGSAALPVTLAMAVKEEHLADGDRVALLGIGSGINVVMLGVSWANVAVAGEGSIPSQFRLAQSRRRRRSSRVERV